LILISAKVFGTVANAWEASLHGESLAEGYLQYQLGKVIIDFSRTGVGFILAVLICASTAVAVSQVKGLYRLLAGACLISNVFLLLATGSFGSIFACLCGLAAIFYTQFRRVNVARVLLSVIVIASLLVLTYSLSPPSMKEYLEKRYEHRVVEGDTDRFVLWARAMDYFLEHPEGVGLTFTVGDTVKSNPHNDYIAYAVSYGVIGGLAYPILVTGLLIYFFKIRKMRTEDHSALAINLAGLSVIVAFAVNSMTDNIGVNRWYFNLIWSLIWYSYFCSRGGSIGRKNSKRECQWSGSGSKPMERLT
jgi:O-antigen ligase